MAWILAALLTLLAGWFVARALTSTAWTGPRWAGMGAELALATLFGPGLASIGFFALTLGNAASTPAVFAMLTVLVLGSGVAWWKFAADPAAPPSDARPPESVSTKRARKGSASAKTRSEPARSSAWKWGLLLAAAIGLALFLLDFYAASDANPNGEWDASAIWNLRARFLAGGAETWRRAVSSELGGHMTGAAHPGYPLFLSSFLALQWMAAGNFDAAVPIAASLLFAVGLGALLTTGLASRRSAALGALGWLLLVASEVFVSQAASQYSDLLQGLAFLAALLLLDSAAINDVPGSRLLIAAGLALGLAPWIKNEGLPFSLAAFGVVVWKFRLRGLLWTATGAAPGLLATIALKLVSEGREAMFPATVGEALSKIVDPSRWWQVLVGFGKAVVDAGYLWTHPVILAVALGLALGLRPSAERRARLWLWIPVAAAFAAEFGLYLITTADLAWHISTSVSRLLAQLWPALIWLTLSSLRTPEEHGDSR